MTGSGSRTEKYNAMTTGHTGNLAPAVMAFFMLSLVS